MPGTDGWRQWGVFPSAIEPPAGADDDYMPGAMSANREQCPWDTTVTVPSTVLRNDQAGLTGRRADTCTHLAVLA